MASSKKTLDINTLTFQTLYIKAQSGSQLSNYTIPVIPGGDTVVKQLIYLTPEQTLSVANIYISPSTIPEILSSLTTISTNQYQIDLSVSSISDMVGLDVSSIQGTTNSFITTLFGGDYPCTNSTIYSMSTIAGNTNLALSNFNGGVIGLESTLSSVYSITTSSFTGLGNYINISYNQGPSVSSLSTYFTSYFNGLAESIPLFSTPIGISISTTVFYDASTVIGYSNYISSSLSTVEDSISSLSTVIGSSFSSFYSTLVTYNPSEGMSTLSTTISDTLANYSTLYSLNSGIPGICSMSTWLTSAYLSNIADVQSTAGIDYVYSMSTFLGSSVSSISNEIILITNDTTICTFSTVLQTEVDIIQTQISTVGYINTIYQNEQVKISISTLSTAFGIEFSTIIGGMTPLMAFNASEAPNLDFVLGTMESQISTLEGHLGY